MVDSKRFMDWLEKSLNDIKAAKILKEHHCGYELVAFHSQQAAEKILKAYIINSIINSSLQCQSVRQDKDA